jgi:uncharacterized damage-inducible protein DinB
MKQHFLMFAHYNAWANGKLYDAVATLPAEVLHRDMGAFFGSLSATLNHVLTVDRLWLARLTGEGEAPDTLDQVAHEEFEELRAARDHEDARLVAFVERLAERDLDEMFRYRGVRTTLVVEQTIAEALAHVFNHQTHHRGETRCLLTQLQVKVEAFDLMYFQREASFVRRRVA